MLINITSYIFNMILLNLGGGLGNQMFRYAAAWSLQQKTGEKLFVSFKGFESGERECSLNNLNIPNMKICPILLEKFIWKYMKIKYKLSKLDNSNTKDCEKLFKIGYCKTRIRKYIEINEKPMLKLMDGGFQSIRYFDENINEIKKMFCVKNVFSQKNKEMVDSINKVNNSVCVHIRLGDYQIEKYKRFNVCMPDYYKNAMLKIEKMINNPVFFVFTENFDIVKKWELPGNVVFVDLQNEDFEDLQLMYNCKNFIISNSTYSWWAQFLSSNDKKIVIAPNKWFLGEEDNPTALYCKDWILMDAEGKN